MRTTIGLKLITGFLSVIVLIILMAFYSLHISHISLEESVGRATVFLVEETLKRIDQSLYRRAEDLQPP